MKKIIWVLLASLVSTVNAATYYVSQSTGKDTNTGLSHAQAWKTIAKVNSAVTAVSSDVYFLAGDTWSGETLRIDWAGTSSDRAIIGSYYMNGGTETVGVPSGTSKPIIGGGFTGTTSIGNVPSGIYGGLVTLTSPATYNTVQNLRIINSSGHGITGGPAYTIIEDNEIDKSVGGGIFLFGPGDADRYSIVRNNVLTRGVWSREYGINPYPNHPPCLAIDGQNYTIVENNQIIEGWCEGIDFFDNANYNIARDNLIVETVHVGVYIDKGSYNVVENNIIVGGSQGIASSIEGTGDGVDNVGNVLRNNIITNVTDCFYFNLFAEAVTAGRQIGTIVVGNTCIDAQQTIEMQDGAASYATTVFKNNLFYNISFTGADYCRIVNDADITVDANHWGEGTPTDADCQSVNDTTGNPQTFTAITTGLFTKDNIPTATDFTPANGSPVENQGADLDSVALTGSWLQSSDLQNVGSEPFDTNQLGYEYDYDARNATTPDIGAIEIGDAPILPSDVSLPFYMNIGGNAIGPLASGKSYETEQYLSADGANASYTNSNAIAIDGTTDDLLYQTWRGKNGTMSWSIPIANGNYDLTLLYQEHYWGVSEGNCTTAGSNRQFDISVEGVLLHDEFDICTLAGAPLTAVRDVIANINVTDGQLDIQLSPGQGQDPKPEIMGLEITLAAPAPSPPTNFIVQ